MDKRLLSVNVMLQLYGQQIYKGKPILNDNIDLVSGVASDCLFNVWFYIEVIVQTRCKGYLIYLMKCDLM